MHTGGGVGEGVSSEKLSHKNAIKHEKMQNSWPPDFLTNPKYPPKKNLAKTPKLCIYPSGSDLNLVVAQFPFEQAGKVALFLQRLAWGRPLKFILGQAFKT